MIEFHCYKRIIPRPREQWNVKLGYGDILRGNGRDTVAEAAFNIAYSLFVVETVEAGGVIEMKIRGKTPRIYD